VISKSYSVTDARQIVGNSVVYVGGSDVTSSNGLPYEKHTSPHDVFVPTNETMYAVCANGVTETLRVLLPDLD